MEVPMGDLLIRNVPDALRADIEKLAKTKGSSLSQTAREALRMGVEAAKKAETEESKLRPGDQLMAIFHDPDATDEERELFGQIMDEIEAERKRDFGRPLPDLE
jgi:antitoxin FitA